MSPVVLAIAIAVAGQERQESRQGQESQEIQAGQERWERGDGA